MKPLQLLVDDQALNTKELVFFSFSQSILLLQIRPNPLRKNKDKNPIFSAERAQNHRTHFDLEALSQEREQ